MADLLLVHGSCHGAWCWDAVIPLLTAKGHTVRAIDLPGHGDDPTPVNDVSLEAYAEAIGRNCGSQTVLVGHSMGGYAIAAAGCLVPEKVAKLVYLCAYVPKDGASLAEMRMMAPYQPLLPAVRMSSDRLSFTIDPEMATGLFYHDCPEDVARNAVSKLCSQATAPTNVTFSSTPELRGLPRHYIRCMDDRTIPPEFQVTMTSDWTNDELQEMRCGHSPFFADPVGLTTCLHQAVSG